MKNNNIYAKTLQTTPTHPWDHLIAHPHSHTHTFSLVRAFLPETYMCTRSLWTGCPRSDSFAKHIIYFRCDRKINRIYTVTAAGSSVGVCIQYVFMFFLFFLPNPPSVVHLFRSLSLSAGNKSTSDTRQPWEARIVIALIHRHNLYIMQYIARLFYSWFFSYSDVDLRFSFSCVVSDIIISWFGFFKT